MQQGCHLLILQPSQILCKQLKDDLLVACCLWLISFVFCVPILDYFSSCCSSSKCVRLVLLSLPTTTTFFLTFIALLIFSRLLSVSHICILSFSFPSPPATCIPVLWSVETTPRVCLYLLHLLSIFLMLKLFLKDKHQNQTVVQNKSVWRLFSKDAPPPSHPTQEPGCLIKH